MKHLIVVLLLSSATFAQEHFVVSGIVLDANANERLASANIRVVGTSQGTVANAEGAYRLLLWPGKRIIIVSSLGYKPDTLHLMLTMDEVRNVALTPSDIILPEVVVSSEDPAIEIIRRAIASKRQWIERLKSFEMDAFTRQVLKRDTSIASITESFTKGYWQQGDTLREIIKQKRQTENIKSEFNFASVGRILNFNDDEIRFIGYSFVGPTAVDALDYYDYKLQRTRTSFGKEIHEIKMIPRTRTTPLFEGIINIAGDSYALMGVDVQPNEAFSLPFVKEKSLRYRQQFGLHESAYWMPADIRIDVSATISVIGISIPRITFSQTSVVSNYAINPTIPDSIFRKQRLTVDSLAITTFDSTLWRGSSVLPLTREEEQAYKMLDSTQTLDVQFRRGGFSFGLGVGEENSLSLFKYLDFSFNRVEGFHLGGKIEADGLSTILNLRTATAYGFSDKRMKYNVGATIFTSPQRKLGFGVDVYRKIDHRPDAGYYGVFYNSLTSLLAKNDYQDYYQAVGWRTFIAFKPSNKYRGELSFTSEDHSSVQQNSDISLFAHSRSYRINPPIKDGRLRSLRFDARIGEDALPFEIIRRNSIELHTEYSNSNIGSDFRFNRIWGKGTLTVPTLSRSLLFPQALTLRLSAGTSDGNVPSQRLFDLESASSGYAPFGVMRAMNVKEFSGTSYVALNAEHNFRSVPFLALGIPFLYENNIEFIVHSSVARTSGEPIFTVTPFDIRYPNSTFPTNITNGWYSEIGFGFSRIFDLLRADFTWRLSAPGNFRFTLGVANLF